MLNIQLTDQDYLAMDNWETIQAQNCARAIEANMPQEAKELFEKDLHNLVLNSKERVGLICKI